MSDKPVQTLRIPGNPYEGAPVFSARSADGALYVIYAGVQPGSSTFAQQCAVLRDGKWSWLKVPQAWHARPSITLEHDGLYMTYASSEATTVRWRVPGFVVPGGSAGLTEQQVRDIAWALVPDAVYADLQARGGIYGHIRAIVEEIMREGQ